MVEVKKNFCDDRIAVRQLASRVYLAGVTSACQRKLLVESSVGWLSRTSRRHSAIAIFDFLLLLLLTLNFLEFHRSLDERERTSCRFPELLSEWFGSVGRIFYEQKTAEILPRVRDADSRTTRVNSACTCAHALIFSYFHLISKSKSDKSDNSIQHQLHIPP